MDTMNTNPNSATDGWCSGKVIKVEPTRVRVHFVGWSSRYDEWVRKKDFEFRLRPFSGDASFGPQNSDFESDPFIKDWKQKKKEKKKESKLKNSAKNSTPTKPKIRPALTPPSSPRVEQKISCKYLYS